MLGVLGGMGPAATTDWMAKLVRATPAQRDQDHIPLLLYSDAQTPDRTEAILSGGSDPAPAMLDGVRRLEAGGAQVIAIPCNTAHHWHGMLQRSTRVPILHIVDGVRKGSGRHPGHDRDRAQRLLRQTASSDRPNVSLSVFRAPSGRHAIDPPRESWRRRPSPRRLASRHSPSFGARCRNDRTGVHRTAPRPPHRGQALPDRRWRQSRAALPQVVDSSIPSTGDG
jgi:hypothetical protein